MKRIRYYLPLLRRQLHYSLYQRSNSTIYGPILGIETSCDDTGCAIIDDSGNILGESVRSQSIQHLRFGGINPVISRELHRNNITEVVEETLKNAKLSMQEIQNIAVTVKPGLESSLKVGLQYAKYLCKYYNKSLIPVHHMKAHALVTRMLDKIFFPYLVLLISGGHCLLAVVKDVDSFLLLGESIDDAPGEAFDKTARRMKLKNIPEFSKMPGGAAIELAASRSKNPELFNFPLPLMRYRDCNFSMSGLKDSVRRKILHKEKEYGVAGDELIPEINDLCASFQIAVARHLAHRLQRGIEFCENKLLLPNKQIVVSGGVACNNCIYNILQLVANKKGYKLFRPPSNLCTDNGVMIAWNGLELLRSGFQPLNNQEGIFVESKSPIGISLSKEVTQANIQVRPLSLTLILKSYKSIIAN